MNMAGKAAKTIVSPTVAKVSFGGKEFKVKHLGMGAILKIASIIGSIDPNTQIIDIKTEKINLGALSQLDADDINEFIALVLRTNTEEVEDLFNMKDFLALAKVVIAQEDIRGLFLEISQLTESIGQE